MSQGSRTFATKNINSPESGYLIPIVNVTEDVEYLRRINSPMAAMTRDWGRRLGFLRAWRGSWGMRATCSVNGLSTRSAYLSEVNDSLHELMHDQVSVLEGLTNDEVLGVLIKSNIINCKAGDHVIKKGGTAHNMFVLLEGHVEVYEGDSMVAVFGPGDIFGAMAFLLECERVTDIWAATDCRILSLSESTIRASIESDAQGAAH